MPEPRCDSCRFWRHHDERFGQCHRYPPVLGPCDDEYEASTDTPWFFPMTLQDDFCGEFQSADTSRTP